MAKTLNVFLHGQPCGQLVQKDDGRLSFAYTPAYIQQSTARAVSLALPLAETIYDHRVCHAVFGGMLPEGDVRVHLAKALGVSEKNDFSLLAEIGGECAGAVSLWRAEGSGPKAIQAPRKKLSESSLENLFKHLPMQPLLTGEGVRLSLAGAQNKLALVQNQDHFYLPTDDEPSTHILKIAPKGYESILENELYCLRLARHVGLAAATVSLGVAGSVRYLCVERFDRERTGDGKVRRLHQEDFCQALGVPAENKYQREEGPSVPDCIQLLRQQSTQSVADIAAFLRLLYFNYLIGNADAHAKNYSMLFEKSGTVLAPAYDVLCTAIYSGLDSKMAMKIDTEYQPSRVALRHWKDLAKKCDLKPSYVVEGLQELVDRVKKAAPLVAEALIKELGPNKVFGEIQTVFKKRAAKASV